MTTFSSDKKDSQLGMSNGTATARLRKNILFSMIKKLELDVCFQCGNKIETVDELSIEHKIPWLDSEDPIRLFFDLDNIAFSHLKCNVGAVRYEYKRQAGESLGKSHTIDSPEGMHWCGSCKQFLPYDNFSKKLHVSHGLHSECHTCRKERRNR